MLKTSYTNSLDLDSINSKETLVAAFDQWIAALESGEYKQTVGLLRRLETAQSKKPNMCCLGVLCDIVDGNKWNENYSNLNYDDTAEGFGYIGVDGLGKNFDATMPSSEISDAFFLDYSGFLDYELSHKRVGDFLVELNDDSKSYKKVIKVIKKIRDYFASDKFDYNQVKSEVDL